MLDKPTTIAGFRLDRDTHYKLKELAAREKTSITALILGLLDKAFPGWRGERVVGK